MTPERLTIIAGFILSIVCGYVPPVKKLYDQLATEWKITVMGGLLLITALGAFGLSCAGIYAAMECTKQSAVDLATNVITALLLGIGANQGTYALFVKPIQNKQIDPAATFGKLLILVFLVGASLSFVPQIARAEGPLPDVQDWMYPASEYAFGGDIAKTQQAFKNFQDSQAEYYNYGPNDWKANYDRDVTAFLKAHGCASCYITATESSYKIKIDTPVAMRDINPTALRKYLRINAP